jgi:DNA-binding CsgD family transcriptional regulator
LPQNTLIILLGIDSGYRPSQIAEQLGISPQLVNYYTEILLLWI